MQLSFSRRVFHVAEGIEASKARQDEVTVPSELKFGPVRTMIDQIKGLHRASG
jgi:hypothetical protein